MTSPMRSPPTVLGATSPFADGDTVRSASKAFKSSSKVNIGHSIPADDDRRDDTEQEATTPLGKTNDSELPQTNSSTKHSGSYLTRKAHRFSSLKKKKAPTTLLNRLFCNSPSTSGNGESGLCLQEIPSDEMQETVGSGSGEENQSPEEAATESTCSMPPVSNILETFSETITLHAEQQVRRTFQSSIVEASESMISACGGRDRAEENSSPPTVDGCRFESESATDEKAGGFTTVDSASQESSAMGFVTAMKARLSSPPGKVQSTPNRKPMNTPGGLVIPSPFAYPSTQSMLPSTLEKAFSPAQPTKAQSSSASILKDLSSVVDTLSINADAKTDNDDGVLLVRMLSSQEDLSTVVEASESRETATQMEGETTEDEDAFLPDDFKAAFGTKGFDRSQKVYTWDEMQERIAKAIKEARAELQTDFRRKSSATTDVDVAKVGPFENGDSTTTSIDINDEMTAQLKEKHEEEVTALRAEYERRIEQHRAEAKSLLKEHGAQWKKESKVEIEELKAKYERRINEQKDQAAWASRLAKMRQAEIERMEAEIGSKNSQLEEMELKSTSRDADKDTEIETIKKELLDVKKQLDEKTASNVSLEQALAQVNEKLAAPQDEPKEDPTLALLEADLASTKEELMSCKSELSEMKESTIELLQQDFAAVKEQLSKKEEEISKLESIAEELEEAKEQLSIKTEEISKLKLMEPEFNQAKEQLSLKDEEISKLKLMEPELTKTQNEVVELKAKLTEVEQKLKNASDVTSIPASRSLTPTRRTQSTSKLHKPTDRSSRSPVRGTTSSMTRKELDNLREVFEEEKKSLLEQIGLLEDQAANSRQEHEKALQALRQANEEEIKLLTKETEAKLEEHAAKEKELQQTLETVASREREELLDQIEQLEADKKADRTGGLREVQRKEDLLRRISELEKKEKDLVEDHARNMAELRQKNEATIQNLREEKERQQELHYAKEKELRLAISETSSFEKEELLVKIEKLESQLESEKSGAVLVKMKVTAIEKEAKVAEADYQEKLEKLQSELKSKIQSLEDVSETKKATEARLVKAVAERDELAGQLNDLQTRLEVQIREHSQKTEELCNMHSEEIARVRKEFEDQISAIRHDVEEKEKGFEIIAQKSSDEEKELRSRIEELERKLESETNKYEQMIKAVEERHSMELDELLAQLDLVEAEHKEKLVEQQKLSAEKDDTIIALSNDLVKTRDKNELLENARAQLVDDLERMQRDTTILEKVREELQSLQTKHEQFVVEAEKVKERACEAARNEMIQRAEVEFKQANDLYVKLKKQYDAMKAKAEHLGDEVKKCQTNIETIKKEKESLEVDLNAELAQVKANKAKIEAETAQKAKDYRREMAGLLKAAKDFEDRCQEAETAAKDMKKKLSVESEEKKRLQTECSELKNVCEELMAIVEGPEKHEF